MIRIFINALSASAGGGLTYVRNVLPHLARREDVHTTLLVGQKLGAEITESSNVETLVEPSGMGSARRFWHEQTRLASFVRRSGADVLLSTGNFAVFRSPVPQILLSRNALYISEDFFRDVRGRGDYRLWFDTKVKGVLARCSVWAADCTVAPSQAFAGELQSWGGKKVICVHHGFDRESFFDRTASLSADAQAKLASIAGSVGILFVSHYNYYRNFETLIRGVAILKEKLHPRPVRLILTCLLKSEGNPGSYRAENAAELVTQLKLNTEVVELGAVPYTTLHHLYESCDVYATPAYAETFAHPLVEAMASGLPVIASDIAVHREICGEAALYFPKFSADLLAERIIEVTNCEDRKALMRARGLSRSADFSWKNHVDQLVELAEQIAGRSS